jgi:hypothetical protein
VTEQEWLACGNFHEMLECFRGKVSERKLRLLCVALCRHIWDLLDDPACRDAVDVTERCADGLATPDELERAYRGTSHARTAANKAAGYAADSLFRFYYVGEAAVCVLDAVTIFARRSTFDAENKVHVRILRDIFGNPFRPPPALDPLLLNRDVLALARGAYEQRSLPEGTLDPCPPREPGRRLGGGQLQ